MRIVIVGGDPSYLLRFRGDLISTLTQNGHDVHAIGGEANTALRSEIESRGCSYTAIEIEPRGTNPLKEWSTLRMLKGQLRALNPDLVIAYTPKMIAYAGLACRNLRRTRFVAFMTGLGSSFINDERPLAYSVRIARCLLKIALKQAHHIFFQNVDDQRDLSAARLFDSTQAWSLLRGSGVDTDHFAQQPMPEQARVILFIGRLMREKGLVELIEASRIVHEHHPEVEFRILGSPESARIGFSLQELNTWGTEPQLRFIGQVADVRPHLQEASIFVLPSYREGTPRSTLEALSVGRAIVTTDVPGCRETVIEGLNGYLVAVRDSQALATTLSDLLDKPSTIKEFGQASRALAVKRFDVHSVNRSVMKTLGLSA